MNEPPDVFIELRDQIFERLKIVGIDPATVKADTPLFKEGLALDSLDALEISVLVEEKYGIVIAVSEREKSVFGSMGGLAKFVGANLGRDRPVAKAPGERMK